MRILQVIEFFSPSMGGSVQVAYQISKHLAERGHNVTVVSSDFSVDGSRFPAERFETVLLPSAFSRWGFYLTPGLIAWARKHLAGFDIIHMHNVRTFQNAVIGGQAQRLGVPYVMSPHGSLPLLVERKAAKQAFDLLAGQRLVQNAARLIAVSPTEEQQFIEFGIPPQRVALVYNGLDLNEFAELPPRGLIRRRLGIPDEADMVLFLGRVHRIKGVDHLIAAFAKLREFMDTLFLVVAGPDDGDLKRLQGIALDLGVADRVRFPGGLYGWDKVAALVDADVVASPSQYEIFGLIPFEALMSGTPVVVTEGSASGQLLDRANAGYLVPYGDSEALAEALQQALTDKNRSETMVRAGQAFVRGQLQWPAITRQLETIYSDLVSPQSIPVQGQVILQ